MTTTTEPVATMADVLHRLDVGLDTLPVPTEIDLLGGKREVRILTHSARELATWAAWLGAGEPMIADEWQQFHDQQVRCWAATAVWAGWSMTAVHVEFRAPRKS
jgi:hypothetical protein